LSKLPEESVIIENIVASHLAKRYETFYWKNNREIDIVIKDKELIGFEVKWKERVENYSKIKIGKMFFA
jgi:predicted AAA+ superfamily ATPase